MRYYKITNSLSKKVIGNYNVIKDYIFHYNSDKYYWDEPKFIGNIYFEKIDFEPYLASPVLYSNAKKTDNIISGGPLSSKLQISSKLKSIIEKNRKTGIQFFRNGIYQNNKEDKDYWLMNMYEFNHEYINFEKSQIIYRQKKIEGGTNPKIIKVSSNHEFEQIKNDVIQNNEIIYIEKLVLNEDIITEDFFMLRYVEGSNYIVSEKLKKEIEDAGCTGIEFQPSELSYNEWSAPGGERRKIYGES